MRYSYFLLLVFLLISCEDETVSPIETINMMPMEVGNYWIYDSYALNSSNVKIQNSERTDSLFVNKRVNFEGLDCFRLVSASVSKHDKNDVVLDTTYYQNKAPVIKHYFDYGRESFVSPEWIKLLQNGTGEWDNTIINDKHSIDYKGKSHKIILRHATSISLEDKNLNFQGKTIQTKYVRIRDERTKTFRPEVILKAEGNSIRKTFYFFANNIGIVSEEVHGYKETWTTTPHDEEFELKNKEHVGYSKTLIRWNIK